MIIFDPIMKLRLLSVYMAKRINRKSDHFISFENWMWNNYPEFVYGSATYYREAASHCYYCELPFNETRKASIDHFSPKSKDWKNSDFAGIFVISCNHCNGTKGDLRAEDFIRKVTVSNMKGIQINGFRQKDLKKIALNANKIFNDVLIGNKKDVYYLQKTKSLPKGFIKV